MNSRYCDHGEDKLRMRNRPFFGIKPLDWEYYLAVRALHWTDFDSKEWTGVTKNCADHVASVFAKNKIEWVPIDTARPPYQSVIFRVPRLAS